MDTSYLYNEIDHLSSSNEVISRGAKTQTLNVLKEKFNSLSASTDDVKIKAIIAYNLLMLEDCYNIDMYKFQFKGLKEMIEKDLKNLQEAVTLGNI